MVDHLEDAGAAKNVCTWCYYCIYHCLQTHRTVVQLPCLRTSHDMNHVGAGALAQPTADLMHTTASDTAAIRALKARLRRGCMRVRDRGAC